MHSLMALTYPAIDPVAISLGPVSVRWYGLAYIAGLLLGWLYIKRLLRTPRLWNDGKAPLDPAAIDDLFIYMTAAIVVGGRLGQVLLYEPGYYLANPLDIFKVWQGGMAFHGGFLGAIFAGWLFARQHKVSAYTVWDLCAAAVPLGIFFGRIANFINSEHWGRIADVPWAMVFPNGGPVPRHPSQLYEAALEGLLLLVVLRILTHGLLGLRKPGLVGGAFLVGYGLTRAFCELFREPEVVHAFNIEPLTAGQVYSVPMILVGLWAIWMAQRLPRADAAK